MIVQCFTSPPTQYRSYGRRFLQGKRPNQQYQSTERKSTKENAKVSVWQQCMYEGPLQRNLRQINARKIKLKSTFSGLHDVADNMVYLHYVNSCCLPKLRNPAKFWKIQTHSSSRSSKVIDLGVDRKHICDFLLVNNSNFGSISYRFPDFDVYS